MPLAGVYGAVEPALVREDSERLERQESERRETLLQSGKARGPCAQVHPSVLLLLLAVLRLALLRLYSRSGCS